jgi:hypothetical protein
MSPSSSHVHDQPEAPAEIRRAVVLGRLECCGLGILIAIPILAMAGWLGDGRASREVASGGITLQVDYPRQARAGHGVVVAARVSGDRPLTGRPVTVEMSANYLESFGPVTSRPTINELRAGAAAIRQDLEAGPLGTEVVFELTPRLAGRARGWIRAVVDSGERAEVEVETWILP